MAAHSHSLRSRLNGQSPSARITPTSSPSAKTGARSPRKAHQSNVSLQLQRVIGTTTNSPTGLACCPATSSYAYCAGAVAVLATVRSDGSTTYRYFRARPTAPSINPSSSYYEPNSPSTTSSRRRTSIFSSRKTVDVDGTGGFGREWLDDNSSQTWTARERIKAVTCVALSNGGRWLAVGESGYNPRVLLYSTADDAVTDIPMSIISDHAIGVRSVAFSPDSRYLATLGTLNDGFLFAWSLNPRTGSLTLHSANKCTTNICDMTWCDQYLVTVGTRHVKVWHPENVPKPSPAKRFKLRPSDKSTASPRPSTLVGRNALLGCLVDCNFSAVVAISRTTVLVGSDSGHLCALGVSDGCPELRVLKLLDFEITSLAWQDSKQRLVLGGRRGIVFEELIDIERMLQSPIVLNGSRPCSPRKGRRSSAIRQSLGLQSLDATGVSALGCLSEHMIALDSDGNLHTESSDDGDTSASGQAFASHNDLIQGVGKLPAMSDGAAFFTWSRHGEVRFWDTGGRLIDQHLIKLEQQDSMTGDGQNELRVCRYISNSLQFVAGDRFGVLQVIDRAKWQTTWSGRAHGAEITDIAVHEGSFCLTTSSRDQTTQLFAIQPSRLELMQTMDDHIGAVNHVMFSNSGEKLLSSSADRTIIVRERAQRQGDERQVTAYLPARVVTLRSAPLSMTWADDSCETLLVSTMDRHLVKVETASGAIADSAKVTDPDNDDTVALNSIAVSEKSSTSEDTANLLVAVSSTDKSLRVYDANKCILLTRESGHTEGISDLCLLEDRSSEPGGRTVVSTGLDGTIMLWNISTITPALLTPADEISQAGQLRSADSDKAPSKASPASLPPLRKVLTKLDVLEFSKSSGISSPASPRSLSPARPGRLARKKSNLALSTTINEQDEELKTEPEMMTRRRKSDAIFESERSPSPPPTIFAKPKKHRSRSELADAETRRALARRSPSPPPLPVSQPSTPKHRTVANNGRLRRPPSVPTDLRAQALAQGRRQSMSQASDFGSMGMATEQACRMLRAYRKKLMGSKEDLTLDELEDELETIMKIVKERKERAGRLPLPSGRRANAKAATENDVDELAVLLERANMKDTAGSHQELVKV